MGLGCQVGAALPPQLCPFKGPSAGAGDSLGSYHLLSVPQCQAHHVPGMVLRNILHVFSHLHGQWFPFVVYKECLQSIILTTKSGVIHILILKGQNPRLPELSDHQGQTSVSGEALNPVLGWSPSTPEDWDIFYQPESLILKGRKWRQHPSKKGTLLLLCCQRIQSLRLLPLQLVDSLLRSKDSISLGSVTHKKSNS